MIPYLEASYFENTTNHSHPIGSQSFLNARLWRMQTMMDDGLFELASKLSEDIKKSLSPVPKDMDIEIIFQFVNQSLVRLVPLIGGTGVALAKTECTDSSV